MATKLFCASCYASSEPMNIEEIEDAIKELSAEELASFRAWFAEFDADRESSPRSTEALPTSPGASSH
jgi:hypothetical protein